MVEFILNGTIIKSPPEWSALEVNASFVENIQPDITVDELTFGFDACVLIKDWISLNGFFRGMPLLIKKNGTTVFDGYLDFKTKYIEVHQGKYLIAIKMNKGLNQLVDYINGYTFSLLAENTNLTYTNIPYVVEKKTNLLEEALVSITTLLLLKELYESVQRLSLSLNEFTRALLNTPFNVGDVVYASIKLLVDLAYTVAMVIALKNLVEDLLSKLISPVKFHKSINVKSALNSFFNTVGYNGFVTGISELENLYYYPSKEEDNKSKGIPNATDNGYLIGEFIQLIRDTFNAKIVVDSNNVVQLRSENDPYFVRTSTYTMPDTLLESKSYNIQDLKGTYKIGFNTDVKDEWTIENYIGTSYEAYTSSTNSNGVNLITGLEEVNIPLCLGNRKDGLNTLETLLRNLGGLADTVINALGGNSNLAGKVTARIGMLKVSNESWSIPKLLLLNNQFKLNSNHRLQWSASVLYNKYHVYNSFVANNYNKQRQVFSGVEITFCIEDYNKLINNSYFTTNTNKIGKFTNIKMGLDSGKATADFWVQEPYDKNLIEIYVEP